MRQIRVEKVVALFVTFAMAISPAHSETLRGGVDYNEAILDLEDGKAEHGTKIIEWNSWVDKSLRKIIHIVDRGWEYQMMKFPPSASCHYTVNIKRNGQVNFMVPANWTLASEENPALKKCVVDAWGALEYTKDLQFPRGSQRSEITIDAFFVAHKIRTIDAEGYNETQVY